MTVDAGRAYDTARRMLARYSSATVAADMAHWHAMDYPPGDPERVYWQLVGTLIRQIGKAN